MIEIKTMIQTLDLENKGLVKRMYILEKEIKRLKNE